MNSRKNIGKKLQFFTPKRESESVAAAANTFPKKNYQTRYCS